MPTPIGICPMCRTKGKLCNSHLMSAAIYPLCRNDEFEPVRVTAESMRPTVKQTKEYLLCSNCENNLSKNGERFTIPLMSELDGPFRLHDHLAEQPPVLSSARLTIYAAANNSKINVSDLIHFGIGIFWKASVHPFGSGSDESRIDLGEDSEALRLYLRDEANLPDHIALVVGVESGPVRFPAMIDPLPGDNPNFKSFFFYVPGMQFQLYFGKGVREAVGKYSINVNPEAPILMVPLAKDMRSVFRKHGAGAYRTEKLLKNTAEIAARGLDIKLDN